MSKRPHRRHQRLLTASCALLLALPLAAADGRPSVTGFDLPELGQPADLIADPALERRLGQAWLRQLQATTPLWRDDLVRDYIEALLYRLAAQADFSAPQFSLVVVDDRQVNAFAVPGGVVGINTGLILTAESEDEVASVLAHELGHLSQRHFARSQDAGKYNQWIALGGLLASIAAAAAGGGSGSDLGLAAGLSAQAAVAQNQLRYSRLFEQEADRLGLQTLTRSGYDPRAMPVFFLRMERSSRQLGYIPEFLLTHPLSSSRLADLERRVATSERKLSARSPDFSLAQVRLQVAYSASPDELVTAYRKEVDSGRASQASQLGLTLALLRTSQLPAARASLAPLLAADPDRIDYLLTASDIALAERDYDTAWKQADSAWSLYPDRRAALERLTRAGLAAGKADVLRPRLDRALRRYPNDLRIWRQLADCAASQKDSLTVFRARAEILFLSGRLRLAEEQINNALRLARDNYSLTAQLNKRLREMRELDEEFRG